MIKFLLKLSKYFKYYILILILFTSNFFFSQNINQNYKLSWINNDEELDQLSVKHCAIDNEGFVWIGTEFGLYRYDGANIVKIKDEKFLNFSTQRITELGKDYLTGKIYFEVYPDKSQYVIYNNQIKRLNSKTGRRKVIFTSGELCFTDTNPLIKKILQNSKNDFFLKKINSNTFPSAVLTNDYFYVPNFNSLFSFDSLGKVKKINTRLNSGYVLLQFVNKVLVIDKKKITLIDGGKVTKTIIKFKSFKDSCIFNSKSKIQVFRGGNNYYVKSKTSVYKIIFQDNLISTQFLFNIPVEYITTISYCKENNVYFVGTQTEGIAVFKPIQFNSIILDERKDNKFINICYAVTEIPNNNWYCTSGWFFNTKTKVTKRDNYFRNFINLRFILPYKNKYYVDSNFSMWNIETKNKDFNFRFPNKRKYDLDFFTGSTYLNGQLYITNSNMLFKKNNTTLETFVDFNQRFKEKQILGISSINNVLLILTTKGLFNYSPFSNKINVVKGLEKVSARFIKFIDRENYLLGCYGDGLFLVYKNKVFHAKDSNLDLTSVHAIEQDNRGDLWISTNNGLLKINKQIALQKILKNQPINCYRYSKEDGLLTNEFNGGSTHPSLLTKDGIIGFPSMKGFVWFNPKNVRQNLFNNVIRIDKVILNNEKIAFAKNNKYFIPNDTEIIKFNFSYAYYFNRNNLTVAYRFADQAKWTIIKGNSFQISRYKKGNQQLLLRIITHGCIINKGVTQSFDLNFEERYYEMWWYRLVCIVLLIFFIFSSFLLGKSINNSIKIKLKEKIKERTIQLQELILNLENSQKSLSNSLYEKDILLKEIHHRVKNNLQLVLSMMSIQARRNQYLDINQFVEQSRNRVTSMMLIHQTLYQGESLEEINVALYIQILSDSIIESFDNKKQITTHIEANAITLNLATAIPLALILNEIITNALKYAFPQNKKGVITIIVQHKIANQYQIVVKDDGVGFTEIHLQKKSFGIELIKLLVSQLKGTLKLEHTDATIYTIDFEEIEE